MLVVWIIYINTCTIVTLNSTTKIPISLIPVLSDLKTGKISVLDILQNVRRICRLHLNLPKKKNKPWINLISISSTPIRFYL